MAYCMLDKASRFEENIVAFGNQATVDKKREDV